MKTQPELIFISDNRGTAAREAARHLLNAGYRVALNDLGGPAVPGTETTALSLADRDALSAYFTSCGEALHAVIHAEPPAIQAKLEDVDDERFQEAFREGALASMMLTAAAGAHLAALGRGAMIFLGSIHAEKPMGYGLLHSISCASTQMLCREAALDFGAHGVNCFYIQRGIQEDDLVYNNNLTNIFSATDSRYPQGHLPDSGYLNDLIVFLLTDGAGPLNGADLRADAGLTMFYGHRRREVDPT